MVLMHYKDNHISKDDQGILDYFELFIMVPGNTNKTSIVYWQFNQENKMIRHFVECRPQNSRWPWELATVMVKWPPPDSPGLNLGENGYFLGSYGHFSNKTH